MSLPSDEVRAILSPDDLDVYNWLYNYTRDGTNAILLHGMMSGVAANHPDFNYWEILREARRRLTLAAMDRVRNVP